MFSLKREDERLLCSSMEKMKAFAMPGIDTRGSMHGINLTTQMDIFYHAMDYTSKGIIDATCFGALKRKSVEEANQLIEDLAKSNYKAPSETSGSSSRLR